MAEGPEVGLAQLDALAGSDQLATYSYFHAARADLLRRVGRWADAATAYRLAIELTSNDVERAFLARRLVQVETASRAN
jgi:RNA polymerase sigma-70 factor (ECF subfamily)